MDSKLQIISGTYRGRRLALPSGGARPTQNMARGAIFNMLTGIFEQDQNLTVWDAFAGSGALGMEILSRYPKSNAIFTDVSSESLAAVRKNTDGIAANRIRIVQADAAGEIKRYAADSDLIFVDPPYANPQMGPDFVAKLANAVRCGAIVVQEIEASVPYSVDSVRWEILRDKVYGRARFLILRRTGNK